MSTWVFIWTSHVLLARKLKPMPSEWHGFKQRVNAPCWGVFHINWYTHNLFAQGKVGFAISFLHAGLTQQHPKPISAANRGVCGFRNCLPLTWALVWSYVIAHIYGTTKSYPKLLRTSAHNHSNITNVSATEARHLGIQHLKSTG